EYLDALGGVITVANMTEFETAFATSVSGQSTFRVSSVPLNLGTNVFSTPPASVRVALRDAVGNKSAKVTQAVVPFPTKNANDTCDSERLEDVCVVGTYCKAAASGSPTGTCTAGTAPTLTSAVVFNGDAGVGPRVSVKGTDPEGDITSVLVQYVRADGG